MSAFNYKESDKDKERDEQRKRSMQAALKEKEEKPEGGQEENKKDEKELDFDEKNSYIDKDDGGESDAASDSGTADDEEKQRLQAIVDKTFGGDPYKAVKSWREGQKSFTQMREEFNNLKAEKDSINKVLTDNPELADLFKRAYRGELRKGDNIQNFLNGDGESRDKPSSPSVESKLDAIDTKVDEKTLVEAGLLNKDSLEYLTPEQKNIEVQRAKLAYLERTLPDRLVQQASKKYEEQIAQRDKERQLREQRSKNTEINKSRYHQGIQTVVDEYGLDFSGEDKKLLDEIDNVALHIVDPSNPYVMDEDAVMLATQKVLRKHGREITPHPYKQKKEEVTNKQNSMYTKNQFNANSNQPETQTRPVSIAEKLQQRRLDNYKRDMESRGTRKTTT